MKLNSPPAPVYTHEGARAKNINAKQSLRRSVMSCLLWEKEFYEEGMDIATRIAGLIPSVPPQSVSDIAIEAREKMKLRHMPLFIVREMARHATHRFLVRATLARVIQRPDELAEFLAIYWKDGKTPIAKQIKLGLADAFQKFNAYSLAKYNRDGAIKLRDVLFLCHAKPKDEQQKADWKQLIDGTLPVPDTWEVTLSAGTDKLAAWTRLLNEDKLGALALLRNLRNMQETKVPDTLIRQALTNIKTERVLPFRFIAAARHAPQLEPQLEAAMFKCLTEKPVLTGTTILLVDVSGSMDATLAAKSDMTRLDAACGLAMLLREVCQDVIINTFSAGVLAVPPRRGFALRDAIVDSQPHDSTELGIAVHHALNTPHDRLIVITDEQSATPVPDPIKNAYMINVASAKNGVGYGSWTHIDGWSEAVIDFISTLNGSPDIPAENSQ